MVIDRKSVVFYCENNVKTCECDFFYIKLLYKHNNRSLFYCVSHKKL